MKESILVGVIVFVIAVIIVSIIRNVWNRQATKQVVPVTPYLEVEDKPKWLLSFGIPAFIAVIAVGAVVIERRTHARGRRT